MFFNLLGFGDCYCCLFCCLIQFIELRVVVTM